MAGAAGTVRRSGGGWWVDLALLALLCLAVYFPGLDHHGVTNWQEAQRLIVARDMQTRGDWLVPTVYGKPYLAKPPMVYWATLAVAGVCGERVELWHLRFVVAAAGLAGVLATYVVARRMLRPGLFGECDGGAAAFVMDEGFARRAALWAAVFLATGILYVRSSRIGELDIIMAPFVAAAVGGIGAAWRAHRERRRANWTAILLAALAGCGAVLTKDPAIMVIGLAGFGGIALWTACRREGDEVDTALIAGRGREALGRVRGGWAGGQLLGIIVGLVGTLLAANLLGEPIRSGTELVGSVMVICAGGWVGWIVARLCHVDRMLALVTALSRTHPLIVIGVPAAARIIWAWQVDMRLAESGLGGVAAELARVEAEDNLRLFVPEASLNNLEAMAFGVGLGSVAAAAGLIWIWWGSGREVLRRRPELFLLLAWVGFGLIAFSVLGKGVARYLTPVWPAVAILGGVWVAWVLSPERLGAGLRAGTAWTSRRRRWSLGLAVVVGLLAAGQSWWYGVGRERFESTRSPRGLVKGLRASGVLGPETRVFTFGFATPALDYHLGRPVTALQDTLSAPSVAQSILSAQAFDISHEISLSGETIIVLYRAGKVPARWPRLSNRMDSEVHPQTEAKRFFANDLSHVTDAFGTRTKSGLQSWCEAVPLGDLGLFTIDNGRTRVGAVRVRAPRGTD